MNAINTISLTKYYGTARGITDLNLTVKEGDFFGFIGPNGAGKSTTIRILLGLIFPSGGTAEIFGKDIREEKGKILPHIGYMPSEAFFYPNMRVGEIIRLSAGLRGKNCKKEAEKLCRRLELDTDKRIRELSLGNRKKVSIVCALQHKPRLCVLDEPTSGLDPLMQREFYEILEECNAQGATIFLSSHVLSEVQRHCTHAAVIREGKLLVSDSMEKLGHTGARRVLIRGTDRPPKLKNIRDIRKEDGTISFLYSGSPGELLNALAALSLTDVQITEPGLEEIFMHYYDDSETDLWRSQDDTF